MSFTGFSEEDIERLNNVQQKAPTHKKALIKLKTKQKADNNKYLTSTNNEASIPEGAKLTANTENADNKTKETVNDIEQNSTGNDDNKISTKEECKKDNDDDNNNKMNDEVQINQKVDLKEFEAKQKLIETQNKKRKELLAKALADRTKRTELETQKLNEIKEEFKKLDAMLSNDVKILRTQIDIACNEYNECQKKYDKIEREYLEMKLLLHQKQEKKEMLTEHLCTIIEKNEERKANKLNELLQKLEIEPEIINN